MLRGKQSVLLILITSLTLFTSPSLFANQADLDAELDQYIEIFNGENFSKQRSAIEPLGWSGLSDPILFDQIEDKLMATMNEEDKVAVERASWYAKALALSGNQKYKETLTKAKTEATHKKVRKHAATALERLAKYSQWNPIISQGVSDAPSGQLEQARIKNMLASGDYPLIRLGAKRIYHAHSDDAELVSQARQLLLSEYKTANDKDRDQVDAIAWLIKALAQSGDSANKPALEEIIANSNSKKIKKYAKKYVANL